MIKYKYNLRYTPHPRSKMSDDERRAKANARARSTRADPVKGEALRLKCAAKMREMRKLDPKYGRREYIPHPKVKKVFYIPHPRPKLTEEEVREHRRLRYKETYVAHPRKKFSPEERIWRRKEIQRLKKANREKKKSGGHVGIEYWTSILDAFDNSCAVCRDKEHGLHKDHWIPLAHGGKHENGNLVPLCPKCNGDKHAQYPHEWLVMKEHGLVALARVETTLRQLS